MTIPCEHPTALRPRRTVLSLPDAVVHTVAGTCARCGLLFARSVRRRRWTWRDPTRAGVVT